jgi:hypothetical protein
MSLYGYLSLNPSVIPSVKSSEKTPRYQTVASFQTKCIVRRRYGRYIPMKIFRRYIPTDFEMEFSPSVILLVFASFLVVKVYKKVFVYWVHI